MQVDALIAGGGCVGALTSGLLAQAGWRVALATPQPLMSGFDGNQEPLARVIALAPDIEARLAQEGIPREPWFARGSPVHSMHVAVPGSGEVSFGADPVAAQSGAAQPLARIVEVPALQAALETWAQAQGVRRIDEAVSQLRPDGVELESGVQIDTTLVLACDGADSRLRRQAGMNVAQRDYGQRAIVARLRFALPHHDQARQTMTPEGVLGVLPLVDGTVSVVWSLPESRAAYWLGVGEQEFAEGLNLALGVPWGAAQLLGRRQSFPLRNIHSEKLHAAGVCLLGDAAHTVHPLAGLGLNLGLADALTLVDVLRRARSQGRAICDPASLDAWSRQRVAAVAPYRHFIDTLAGLGSRHTIAWRGVGRGFSLVNQLPVIRRFLERRAESGSLS